MIRVDELLARSTRLLTLSTTQRRIGDEPAAMDSLERATATAQAYLESFSGEWLLDARSKQVARIFEEYAWAQARTGAFDKAFAGIEAMRGTTVRLHTMSKQERGSLARSAMTPIAPRPVVRVVDGEARLYIDKTPPAPPDSLSLPPLAPTLKPLLRRLASTPTALVSLIAPEARGLTALICWPDRTFDCEHWAPSITGPVPTPGYDAPSKFRERRLQAISRSLYEGLFGPLDRRLRTRGIKRIVLSAPGWLSRFPLEALFDGEGFVGDRYQVLYLPSFRVGADLARRHPSKKTRGALVVAYAGDDLPGSRVEQDEIRAHLDGEVTVLSPAKCTKKRILKELNRPYDTIHFCCHASYDDRNPLNAALHLVPDPREDRQRITAYEILSAVRLRRAPVVTLSACASGVMDASTTNSSYGLAGAFLRAGARCVIGTRWPVYDDTAATTMAAMYERQRATALSTAECLHGVTSAMRATSGIEDWAAFGCIGIP